MADQSLASAYFAQLKTAQDKIFKLECQLEPKPQQQHPDTPSNIRSDHDSKLILQLERQVSALNGENLELAKQADALRRGAMGYASKVKETSQELRVQRSRAQAKEK